MSLQSILHPNPYNLYGRELALTNDLKVGGSVISNNGLIFGDTPLTITAAETIPVINLNSGIILCKGNGAYNVTIPTASTISNTFSSLQLGQVLTFHLIIDNTSLDSLAVTITYDSSIISNYTNPIIVTNNNVDILNSFYAEHIFHLVLTQLTPTPQFNIY